MLFCDEKYTPRHYLKHKKKTQLFTIEMDEEKEVDEVDDDLSED